MLLLHIILPDQKPYEILHILLFTLHRKFLLQCLPDLSLIHCMITILQNIKDLICSLRKCVYHYAFYHFISSFHMCEISLFYSLRQEKTIRYDVNLNLRHIEWSFVKTSPNIAKKATEKEICL